MPEKGVVQLFEREIGWEERQVSTQVDRTIDSNFFGVSFRTFLQPWLISHEVYMLPILSAVLVQMALVLPLPRGPPLGQRKLRAEFINTLQITGRIHAKARGKELVIAICNSLTHKNFIFRINFRLEAHCFWMPTEWYQNIVSRPPVPRGEKSFAFVVPSEYVDGPARQLLISIQAAFVRPEWTLVFVDHNVMIQFQLMQVSESFLPSDLTPTSKVIFYLFYPTLYLQ
ncbi:hypothetical protein B0H16DRAFT_1833192 [Mycena metata]|uniref:Uncharacterized protein n=1 Tax=Mycena metata TaxID=1033252 RepID=A0AAD7J1Y0_9AGAR|nr:hypothetical protein B0H16DRAFT_1833192 [Mycena metata]